MPVSAVNESNASKSGLFCAWLAVQFVCTTMTSASGASPVPAHAPSATASESAPAPPARVMDRGFLTVLPPGFGRPAPALSVMVPVGLQVVNTGIVIGTASALAQSATCAAARSIRGSRLVVYGTHWYRTDGRGAFVTEQGSTDSPIRSDYPDPLWIQAVKLITDEIAAGRLVQGARLPPERELCQQLGISRVTLRKALLQLVDDGVLASSHGRGWYVASAKVAKEWPNNLESFTETARKMGGLEASSSVIRSEVTPASLDEAEALSIAPRHARAPPRPHPIARSSPDSTRHDDRARCSWETSRASTSRTSPSTRGSTARASPPIAPTAPSRHGRPTARLPMRSASRPESPLLVLRQLVHSADGRAIALSTIRYVGDRYRLRTVFARSAPPR